MQLKEAIYGRRSIRKYETTPVQPEIIKEILEDACMAPSAVNLQPWYFLAITNQTEHAKFMAYMRQIAIQIKPELEARFTNNPEVVEETNTFLSTLGQAPVIILAFLLKKEASITEPALVMSVAAGVENMLLSAYAKGLGTCFMTAPIEGSLGEKIREEFAPDKGELLAAITLGYPQKTPKVPPRKNGRFEIR